MIGEVYHRVLVSAGLIVDPQRIVVSERVGHVRRQCAGEILIAVLANMAERRGDAIRH